MVSILVKNQHQEPQMRQQVDQIVWRNPFGLMLIIFDCTPCDKKGLIEPICRVDFRLKR